MSDSDLIVVHTFGSRSEADLAKSALEAAGIDALVRSDDAGGLRPHMTFVNGADLLVRAEDAPAAREVLDLPARRA
jgi:putative signal transducing protein